MRMSNCFIVIVALITQSCLARLMINGHQPDRSANLVNATVKILTSCNKSPGNAVGLAGNVPGMLLEELWAQKSLPVTLIDNFLMTNGPVPAKFRRKLESFILVASSASELRKILTKMKVSVWWNHLANFLIVDWKSLLITRGCSSALQLLWSAWEMDVLNAKVLCLHSSQELMIYTFNPYTNQAPHFWEVRETYNGKDNVPWTLFRRKYDNGRNLCLGLDFDKTRDLGGHVIRPSVTAVPHCKNGKLCLSAVQAVVVYLLFPALNATYKPLVRNTFEAAGTIDKNGTPSGIIADVANGISDLSLLSRYSMTIINFTILYPHRESGLYAITHYNGYFSQLDKFVAVIDMYLRIGLYAVAFSATLFFKYVQGQKLMAAIMNVLRIIKSEAILKLPKDLGSQFYLAAILLFWTIVSGLYQGKLATYMTKQIDRPNVNRMSDLVDLGYKVYGILEYERFFNGPEFDGRFFGSKEQVCTHHVLEKKKAACVNEKYVVMNEAVVHSLHLSKEPIVKLYWFMQIRENWPIENRVNIVVQRLIEADLIRALETRRLQKIYRLLKISESKAENDNFRQLTVADLDFAFKMVMMGLAWATSVFFFEMGFGRLRKSKVGF